MNPNNRQKGQLFGVAFIRSAGQTQRPDRKRQADTCSIYNETCFRFAIFTRQILLIRSSTFSATRMFSEFVAVLLIAAAFPAYAESRIDAYYKADLLHNSKGGINAGSAYLEDAGLSVDMGLDALFGEFDARAFVYLLWNNGVTFSDRYSGDLQAVSNIDAPQALRIFELWYQQPLTDALSLRVGLYDLNSEFDAIGTAGLFINSSHGIGADYGQSGQAGPSIFPVTSLAARLDWQASEAVELRYAILDGVPGDPTDPSRTAIEFKDGEGVLHALEYNHALPGGMRLGVGGWLYSGSFDLIANAGATAPRQDDGNSGLYGFVDLPVLAPAAGGRELAAFIRYGIANDRINALDSYLGAGAVVTGLLASRPEDQLGLAVASARIGEPFKRMAVAQGSYATDHETTIELTYRARINKILWLQPDIQYVINPGADSRLDNALVVGLRIEISTDH